LFADRFFHAKAKHIKIDYYFVRERVVNKLVDIKFISSKDKVIGGFTKAWAVKAFEEFRRNLNLFTRL
jgi:hypothetical protein